MLKFPIPTYDTEAVRLMVQEAKGRPVSQQDIWNLCREGKPLAPAVIRRGVFHPLRARRIITQMVRRRLATALGRVSERLPDPKYTAACPRCKSIAVTWEGKTLCENGHLS